MSCWPKFWLSSPTMIKFTLCSIDTDLFLLKYWVRISSCPQIMTWNHHQGVLSWPNAGNKGMYYWLLIGLYAYVFIYYFKILCGIFYFHPYFVRKRKTIWAFGIRRKERAASLIRRYFIISLFWIKELFPSTSSGEK